MFFLAIAVGLYGYSIFALGLLGLLKKDLIVLDTIIFLIFLVWYFWKKRKEVSKLLRGFRKLGKFSVFLISLLFGQMVVNLIGALGPELAFDALWYHLTLPKIYLAHQAISYIPGNLLYYSAMPQLTEMYYASALAFSGETLAKLTHFSFGILVCVALYICSYELFKKKLPAIVATLVFYANLVVGWESITAFSDLARTFFECMAIWAFLRWVKSAKQQWLFTSALCVGFAIATKLLAFGTFGILLLLICYVLYTKKTPLPAIAKNVVLFSFVVFICALPWLFFSYSNTGNPVFPFFSNINPVQGGFFAVSPLEIVIATWSIFVQGADPILPMYLIAVPLFYLLRKKLLFTAKVLLLYAILSYSIWLILPKIGGGRFLLPYLPIFSILVSYVIFTIKEKQLRIFLLGIIVFLAMTSIVYRGIANSKYIPVILGIESKEQFLREHLNFDFGDFYDTDGYFAKHIRKHDMVLLYGFHNLYYVDFPFIDSSWVKSGDKYNFVAVQGGAISKKYKSAKLVYENPVTQVKLYNLGSFVTHE